MSAYELNAAGLPDLMYHVGQYSKDGKRLATMSGMGRNRGKWESRHSKRTARRHAATLRREDPAHDYKAEHVYDW